MLTESSSLRRDLLVLVPLAIALPVALIWFGPRTDLTTNGMITSSCVATVILFAALLISFSLRYRRSETRMPRLTPVFGIALMIVASGAATLGIIATADQYDLTKLTFGDAPLSSIHPERKRLLVELLRRTAATSNEDTSAAKAMRPIDPPLYSAASFADKATMAATVASLQAAYQLDLTYDVKQHKNLADFDTQMQSADPAYLQKWHEDRRQQDQLTAQLNTAEAQWVQSAVSLYAFASEHSTEITYKNKTLIYAHPDLRTELLSRVEASQALQKTASAIRRKATAQQNAFRATQGLPLAP